MSPSFLISLYLTISCLVMFNTSGISFMSKETFVSRAPKRWQRLRLKILDKFISLSREVFCKFKMSCWQFGRSFNTLLQQKLIPGGGVLPYIRYIGVCRPIGWGFWGAQSLNRVSFSVFFDIVILRCSLHRVTKLQYPPQRAKRKRYGLLKLYYML